MKKDNFLVVSGIVFSLVAIVHLHRIFNEWPIAINGVSLPIEVSYFGFVLGGVMAYYSYKFGSRH